FTIPPQSKYNLRSFGASARARRSYCPLSRPVTLCLNFFRSCGGERHGFTQNIQQNLGRQVLLAVVCSVKGALDGGIDLRSGKSAGSSGYLIQVKICRISFSPA